MTEVTATVAFVTFTVQVAVFSPAFAVMVAVPAFTAVTFPSFTVATDVFEELHVTVLSVASSGFTVAVSVASSPSVNSSVVLSSVTEVTATNGFSTVTEQVADFPPAWAVMVALPAWTALRRPPLTVTTPSSDDFQVTVLSVALPGLTVAVSVCVSPSLSVRDVAFKLTETTGIVSGSGGLQENTADSSAAPKTRKRNLFSMV